MRDRGVSLIFINTLNDLAMVWSTLSAWLDSMGWDWRFSRWTLARWVVGALSGWIGHRWADEKCSCDFVNNRMRRLRAPFPTHSWVHSGLITKANEWRTRGEEAYKKKRNPFSTTRQATSPELLLLMSPDHGSICHWAASQYRLPATQTLKTCFHTKSMSS